MFSSFSSFSTLFWIDLGSEFTCVVRTAFTDLFYYYLKFQIVSWRENICNVFKNNRREMNERSPQISSCRDLPDKDWGMSDLLFPVWVTADMFDVPVRESETSADPDITLCFIWSVLWFFHKTSNSRDETSRELWVRGWVLTYSSSSLLLSSSPLSENELPSYDSVEEKVS